MTIIPSKVNCSMVVDYWDFGEYNY